MPHSRMTRYAEAVQITENSLIYKIGDGFYFDGPNGMDGIGPWVSEWSAELALSSYIFFIEGIGGAESLYLNITKTLEGYHK